MGKKMYFEVANHELKLEVNELNIKLQNAELQINRLIRQVYGKEHDNFGFVKATGENPYFDQYELQRRSLGYNIDELRFYLDAVLTHIDKNAKISLTVTKDNVADRMRHIVALFRNLQNVDGYDLYREKEAAKIKSLITSRFIEYQTTTSNNVVGCKINITCGFGCQMHHVLYCATFAYNTQRRLILDTNKWSYGNKEAFSQIFKDLPKPATESIKKSIPFRPWSGNLSNPAIELGLFKDLSPRPDFIPLAIPNHLSKSTMILSLHGNPFTLYAGHLIRSVLSIQPEFQQIVDDTQNRFNFSSPVVGIHVRRTDKIGTEARFYHLEKYMAHVEEFFKIEEFRQKQKLKRRVFVATDDPNLLDGASDRYPYYQFLYNKNSTLSASLNNRYSKASSGFVILDILLLSKCDFIVCTFSSNVCRLAYELMQTRYPDGSWRFRSLDDIYHYNSQLPHNHIAIEDHTQSGDISFVKGDIIGIDFNNWNGYCKGTNKRTNEMGLFPCYKTVDQFLTAL
ncbi:hypothetical protein GJ496_009963 [Pomphorhynchus laevis]|nr:hypothetical protein GJ496_009963 [Pomphorhynchus laevis]